MVNIFTLVAAALIVFAIWAFINYHKDKKGLLGKWALSGINFSQEHKIVKPSAILLNDAHGESILVARGVTYITENDPNAGLQVIPYHDLISMELMADHEIIISHASSKAALDTQQRQLQEEGGLEKALAKARIIELDLRAKNREIEILFFNTNDLADRKLRPDLIWWLRFMGQLISKTEAS